MKKLAFVLALASIMAIGTVSAEDSIIRSDLDINVSYNNRFDSGFIFADVMAGLRIGIGADLQFKLGDVISLGAEAGVSVFSWEVNDVPLLVLIDVPVLAKVGLDFGDVELQVHGGLLMGFDISSNSRTHTNVMVGAKLLIGFFEVFGDYVYNTDAFSIALIDERPGYLRVGAGIRIKLVE